MLRLVKITVEGKVQGVFFRESARHEALRLGISGFIRNENETKVYIEAEGSEEDLKKFVDWCRKGPPMAFVETIETDFSDELKNYKGFEIL